MRRKKTDGSSTATKEAQIAQAVTVPAGIPEVMDLNLVQVTDYTEIYDDSPIPPTKVSG
jgi:hypothetical protein